MQATILCYHKVGPALEEGRSLNIEPFRLRSHVRFFARRGRTFVRACDFAAGWPSGSICFTFDDAYSSTMKNAPSIFESEGARATFYAVPVLVGSSSVWDREKARPLAAWDALRAAQSAGHEIGNHSFSHCRLGDADLETQKAEIREAHRRLVAEGLRPGSFCYPYGSLNADALEAVRGAGYSVGMALGKRSALESDDRLKLPRIVVAYSDALPMLLYKIVLKPRLKR